MIYSFAIIVMYNLIYLRCFSVYFYNFAKYLAKTNIYFVFLFLIYSLMNLIYVCFYVCIFYYLLF